MPYFSFDGKLFASVKIKIFDYGKCRRDFSYIDDIVEGVIRIMQGAPERTDGSDGLPMPPWDVPITYADTGRLERDYGFRQGMDFRTGLRAFAEWYKEYYGKIITQTGANEL